MSWSHRLPFLRSGAPSRIRGRSWSAATVDVLITAIVAFPTFMDAGWNQQGTRQADWITFALAGVAVASLLGRRRWPLAVSLVCGSALSAWYLMDHHGELLNLPTMVGLYTVALQGTRQRTVVVGAVASAWSGGLAVVAGSTVGSPMLEMLWPLVPLALGEAVRARHELLAEHAARAARAEADREREARHRVEAERVRIAREFHDVVAHTMAAVNVQMGVAVAAFDTQPETARRALVQARSSTREALQELRATVALLRDGSTPHPAAPAPGLAQIPDLAAPARAAGVEITIHDEVGAVADAAAGRRQPAVRTVSAADLDRTAGSEPGGPHGTSPGGGVATAGAGADENEAARDDAVRRPLPAAVELAAYRVVQEALTNVIRHAQASNATVSLRREGSDLVVEVVDDGVGARVGVADDGAAHGLLAGSGGRTAGGGGDGRGHGGEVADGGRIVGGGGVGRGHGGEVAGSGDRGAGGGGGGGLALGGGHGLMGLAERAQALGGRLEHGTRPEGGFRVRAVLPTGGGDL